MGEEFHKKRVQTNCCLICGPTTDPMVTIIANVSLNNVLNMFIGSDLSNPHLPPNCCQKCRGKYRTYYEKNRRHFVGESSENIEKHRSELQKKNLYPIFPYSQHTDSNCNVCQPLLEPFNSCCIGVEEQYFGLQEKLAKHLTTIANLTIQLKDGKKKYDVHLKQKHCDVNRYNGSP